MAIDWDYYVPHKHDEPLTEEMLQTWTEVNERINHVTNIVHKYREKRWWHVSRWEINGHNVMVHLVQYGCRGGPDAYEEDFYPSAYLSMVDVDIHKAEQTLKDQKDDAERQQQKRDEAATVANKRRELKRLKKELGDEPIEIL